MKDEAARLVAAIEALEAQRALLGSVVVDTATAPLRASLAALLAAAPEQQLKQATVLFLDMVGSTLLSQHLDPEAVHEFVDGAMQRFTTIALAHRGRVLQYAGDSMLAVFGAHTSHEDDPERAVRAGLALLHEGRTQAGIVLQRHGHAGFDVRVGIHTGAVLLGGGVDAEGSIRGLAVNIAARMEQSAPPGALRISHDTYRHVRGVFDVQPQPPLRVKGHDTPIATYLVQRAKPRAFRVASRGVEGLETPMVGRDRELALLAQAFGTTLATGRLLRCTLVGDAGLGKSRLLAEFEHGLELRPETITLFRARAQPQGADTPYAVLRDLLCWRFEIHDSDPLGDAQRKLEAGLARGLGERVEEQAALLGQLIGLDYSGSPHIAGIRQDGRQIRERALHALVQYLRGMAARAPLALLLEDLHWADDGSLDSIETIVQHCAESPMMLLCVARTALLERRPAWGGGGCIRLEPLPERRSHELAAALMQRIDTPPAALHELLVSRAEGNPFHMEELIGMLIDDGVIETTGERWQVRPERLNPASVPPTLVGVLQARLDALPAPEKSALQQASVIGHRFWDAALARLQADAPLCLPALVRRELAHASQTSVFQATREYRFKHHLLHQVTYDGVLKRHKRSYHRATAEWLVAHGGGRLGEFLSLIAEHHERAGDHPSAADYWQRAALDAFQRCVFDMALGHGERALALAASGATAQRFEVLHLRHQILERLGDRPAKAEGLDAMALLAEQLGDDTRRAQALLCRVNTLRLAGHLVQALAHVPQALAWAAQGEMDAAAHHAAASVHFDLGHHTQAAEFAKSGLALARATGDGVWQQQKCLNLLGMVHGKSGDVAAGVAYLEQALALCRVRGDRYSVSTMLNNLGATFDEVGDYDIARSHLLEALRVCSEVGATTRAGHAHANLCGVLNNLGEPAAAVEHLEAALANYRAQGARGAEAMLLNLGGSILLALGRAAEAEASLLAAHRLGEVLGTAHLSMMALAGLAEVSLARGDLGGALQHVEQVLALEAAGTAFSSLNEPMRARAICWRVLAKAGDSRARPMLAAAHGELQARAARIGDARMRHGLLHRVPLHRQLMAAWAAHSG
jgi:predicted ATPase/class 3 adenylate cyclase